MKDRTISLQIQDCTKFSTDFTSLRSLRDFLRKESQFWEIQKSKVSDQKSKSHPHLNIPAAFRAALQEIEGWADNVEEWDDETLNRNLSQVRSRQLQNITQTWLWSGHPFSTVFVQCLCDHGLVCGNAFLDLIVRNSSANIQHADHFKGYMYGYEFLTQDSDLTKRRKGEKSSLGRLRSQFLESRDALFAEVNLYKRSFEEWSSESEIRSDRLFRIQRYLGERRVRNQSRQFEEGLSDWTKAIEELEKTYKEKLKLSKPAEYWREAASKYRNQGTIWGLLLVATGVIGLYMFGEFFARWLLGREIGIELKSLQGAILFTVIAAIYAFLLKVFSRLTFSSFHLMRDAEEREQLTYLYLSLSNESAVDEKSREIILQALFSRSETGLLPQEHGPTMPGVDIIQAAARGAR